MPAQPEDRDERHRAIREILSGEKIANQAELVQRLDDRGIRATQSGLSRDLRLMGVIKQGGAYALPHPIEGELGAIESLAPLLREVRTAGSNLIVCLTEVGSASRAALTLDRARLPEIVGTIAGDDTIFIAVDSNRDQIRLLRTLNRFMDEGRS